MNIIKVNNNIELSEKAAQFVLNTISSKERPILGLATGSTPEKLYELLIDKNRAGEVSFSKVTTFNLDEYAGLSGEDPQSYRYFMNKHLFDHIDIKKEKTFIPNGLALDIEEECKSYEQLIEQSGSIDLQLLGLGLNGHIGFNEPGTPFDKRTHVVALDAVTREANARFFSHLDEVPTQALTMGIGTIMEAKQILLLVIGEKKADILKQVVHGDVSENVPASILQRHPNVTIITDIDV
ncbi:glucosamine-6-phosphate deaminase [Pseudogracilibacillus auburnensis]|uniref:Glucosamine-6-phosphate deaminase n=1 Tax=Pseudogracilibacillus auburnensis TaxID=1494959 RepID=A0A2V3WA18_9BACI|nr:glucosamine-6-phosphate deaminase [Pseudogracilibacillus auburnensis]MBO1005429.1 glucosamine-6-phosphate deaminase [Pseudogracilibacillus auburnensis]PXW90386.1 glucosamine-6-phosphate deaminase [Pseudogracilibacillus auburnensis]